MVFSSTVFLFLFLPIVLAAYVLAPRGVKNLLLLLASLFFYAWGEGIYVLLMLASVLVNYLLGLSIGRYRSDRAARRIIFVSIVFNLGLLIVFKYANFLCDNMDALWWRMGISPLQLEPVHLPIGISFFTFQAMSYVIDVYRGQARIQKNPIDIALYISLFPQLVAGPIVRYLDVAEQIRNRTTRLNDFAEGVGRFVMGLGKKMLIANVVAAPADRIFALPADELTVGLAWLGTLCYTLQIYFDFSGYSDMAIGLGRMFGFRFLENFNFPYISQSITEFWRRWHISLSTWFRDYLYIPLGGNRGGSFRTGRNLVLVFFLCGLWHGASWNFVVWGLFHGAFLVMERSGVKNLIGRSPRPLRHVYVMLVAMVGWVFFRAETLPQALAVLGAMAGFAAGDGATLSANHLLDNELLVVCLIGLVGSAPLIPTLAGTANRLLDRTTRPALLEATVLTLRNVALLVVLLASAASLSSGTYNPFIYFRF